MSASTHDRRRAVLYIVLPFLLCTLLFGVAAYLTGVFMMRERAMSVGAISPGDGEVHPIRCVVIDAGHGGEDGGTSSAAGLVEKDVNLSVAFALRDLLEAAGVPCVMTRTEDKLLYDRSINFQGRKKVLDLAARKTVADSTEDCLLVSIHMNAFPDVRYSGMQVWYGTEDGRSEGIAASIQASSLSLLPDNRRKIKEAGSNIYLLDRATCPAVLVECGFLSNPAEAERLSDEEYRYLVATVIMGGILPHIAPLG